MSRGADAQLFSNWPLMTLSVSRDSGRTWEQERSVSVADGLAPLATSAWPPCLCPRCVGRGRAANR